MESVFDWLQNWFEEHCDNSWNNEINIKIFVISNPGWSVEINFRSAELDSVEIPYTFIEHSDDDWLGISFSRGRFVGFGDTSKLPVILEKFRSIWEQYNSSSE